MNSRFLPFLIAAFSLLLGATLAFGQGAAVPKPAPKAGVAIEPVQGQAQPQEAFTNETNSTLALEYGKTKFLLEPGETKRIQVPQKFPSTLSIYERGSDEDRWRLRFSVGIAPNPQKRFVPLRWAKPNK